MPVIKSQQSRVRHLDNAVHHGAKRSRDSITLIVMHNTAGESAMSSIRYLNTTGDKAASYNYVIDRDGTIFRMLSIDFEAYHAGDSDWPPPPKYPPKCGKSVNSCSVGVSWANRDDGEALTAAQMESALWLVRWLCDTLGIPVGRVVGHYEVSPGRKPDPRPAISMREFRQMLEDTQIQ